MFAKVENGVTKSCPIFRQKNENNAILARNFPLCEQDRLLFTSVEIGVTEFPTKTAKKEKKNCLCRRFFSEGGVHPLFKMSLFCWREQRNFGGGVIT